jgi:hypothetical protein
LKAEAAGEDAGATEIDASEAGIDLRLGMDYLPAELGAALLGVVDERLEGCEGAGATVQRQTVGTSKAME